MIVELSNDFLTAKISTHGAELISVKSIDGLEYIWQADPKIWNRHAPILFPFVGRSKNDQYSYQNTTYDMGQHGFARDLDFEVINQTNSQVALELKSSDQTKAKFPFDFVLQVMYTLNEHTLSEQYHVLNPAKDQELLFSIGGHPGFNFNLEKEIDIADVTLQVAPNKEYQQIPLIPPYSDPKHLKNVDLRNSIQLSREFFKDDALVLDLQAQQTTIEIENSITEHGMALTTINAPFVGVWSPYPVEAPFVCIEPWWGLADTVDANGNLTDKFGINRLSPNQEFKANFEITFY